MVFRLKIYLKKRLASMLGPSSCCLVIENILEFSGCALKAFNRQKRSLNLTTLICLTHFPTLLIISILYLRFPKFLIKKFYSKYGRRFNISTFQFNKGNSVLHKIEISVSHSHKIVNFPNPIHSYTIILLVH